MTIAICGKGGTGKTTLAGLIIRWLLEKHQGDSILAVDADPNANLDETLGIKAENSIVALVDDVTKNPAQVPEGMTKDRFLEYHIQEALVEAKGFDLLVMGRPEGPGCYCFVNNLLRSLIERLGKSYAYIVIDNEAGMEHLSRRTTRKLDLLFIVSDYSSVGLRSAKRILDLTRELELSVKDTRLVINRAPDEFNPALSTNEETLRSRKGGVNQLKAEIEHIGIPLAGMIPVDEELIRLSTQDANIDSVANDSRALKAVNKMCGKVL